MAEQTKITVVGPWEVRQTTVITEDGTHPGITVTDGNETLTTTAPPEQLMIALAHHLDVSSFNT